MAWGTTTTLTFIGKKIKYEDFPYKHKKYGGDHDMDTHYLYHNDYDEDVNQDHTSVVEFKIEGIPVKLVLQFNNERSYALFIVKELITTDMYTSMYRDLEIEANCSSFIEFDSNDLLSADISDELKGLLTPLELITMHEVY
jgi:hypothetical protein